MIAQALRRWKQARRIRQAEAEIAARRISEQPHGLDAPLIVSLTSYRARFGSLHLVLQSLQNQTVRPDRIILWLDDRDMDHLTPQLRALDLEIRTCPEWRSYKKIVPILLEAPDAFVATADDDVYYGPDWLATLVRHAGRRVVGHRAHRIVLDAGGQPRSYGDWQRNIAAPACSELIFPTGVGGVLYAPGVFHADTCKPELFEALAPSADDIWLYWMHRLAGSRPAKIGGRFRITEWPGTQAQNLRCTNLSGDGNDRALARMIEAYGFPPQP